MKRDLILLAIVLMATINKSFADRTLEQSEIFNILEQLTRQSKQSWITQGTIKAYHQEYSAPQITDADELQLKIDQAVQEYMDNPNKAEQTEELQQMTLEAIPFNVRYAYGNEYTMDSSVDIKIDGSRFYWEINVLSRVDSVNPPLNSNFMYEYFDLAWNGRRIFSWDGRKYTRYFRPANHAIVNDTPTNTPLSVNGPLTAGLIPWGQGIYSYETMAAADISGVETEGKTEFQLSINYPQGLELSFILDPAKDYAVLEFVMVRPDGSLSIQSYENYRLVGQSWAPGKITIEKFDSSSRFIARDVWDITSITSESPSPASFQIDYVTDTMVEYYNPVTDRPLMYRHAKPFVSTDDIDTNALLQEKLTLASNINDGNPRNCATVAMKQALSGLGHTVTAEQLASLINYPDNSTTLYTMREYARNLGLYSIAIKTNLEVLAGLQNCQVILHIPGKNHYVVLGNIDEDYVRLIDLTSNKFFYRTPRSQITMDWSEGVALIIAEDSTAIPDVFSEIDDNELYTVIGSSGYSCTKLLQGYHVVYCSPPIGGDCGGTYRIYEERWGCEAAETGSCYTSWLLRLVSSPCINNPLDPLVCTITGDWTSYYMRACN